MSMKILKRKILDFVEEDRADAQVFWAEAFDADGTICNYKNLELAVQKMHSAFLNEDALKALIQLNPNEEEIKLIFKKINGLSPGLGE